MNIKTALVAWNCRLRERAGMIQNCKRHPEDMSVKQWSDAHCQLLLPDERSAQAVAYTECRMLTAY